MVLADGLDTISGCVVLRFLRQLYLSLASGLLGILGYGVR